MTTEAYTTPRPWRYDAKRGVIMYGPSEHIVIAQTWSKHEIDYPNAVANGELIVTAVNSFDAMRDALRAIVAHPAASGTGTLPLSLVDQAEDALLLAEGKE